jgi:hypothetical protein
MRSSARQGFSLGATHGFFMTSWNSMLDSFSPQIVAVATSWFIAIPGSLYPKTCKFESTWPQVRGPQRRVFVAGVESPGSPATGLRRWGGKPGVPSDRGPQEAVPASWGGATGLRRWGRRSGDLLLKPNGHTSSGSPQAPAQVDSWQRTSVIRSYQGWQPHIPSSCYVDISAQLIGDVTLGERSSV